MTARVGNPTAQGGAVMIPSPVTIEGKDQWLR